MTRKNIAAIIIGLSISAGAFAQATGGMCKAWQYISAGQKVYCNTCCYGGSCSSTCK